MLVEAVLRSLFLFGQCAYGEMQSANHQKLSSEPTELEPVTGDPAVPPPSKTDIPSDDGSEKKKVVSFSEKQASSVPISFISSRNFQWNGLRCK